MSNWESFKQAFSLDAPPDAYLETLAGVKKEGSGQQDQGHGGIAVWSAAVSASLLVSLASLICVSLLPLIRRYLNDKTKKSKELQQMLVEGLSAFGTGAMLTDACLHLLPDALGDTGTKFFPAQMPNLALLGGLLAFFLTEKLVRSFKPPSKKAAAGKTLALSSSAVGQTSPTGDQDGMESPRYNLRRRRKTTGGDTSASPAPATPSTVQVTLPATPQAALKQAQHSLATAWHAIEAVGYLNLIADGIHNFTDGLAIGAGFVRGSGALGWPRTLYIMAHELPQEVGDFGILLKAGFQPSQALFWNFMSALTALAGAILALALGTAGSATGASMAAVEAFTAGGFIYVAVAGVLPGMTASKGWATSLAPMAGGIAVCLALHLWLGCGH